MRRPILSRDGNAAGMVLSRAPPKWSRRRVRLISGWAPQSAKDFSTAPTASAIESSPSPSSGRKITIQAIPFVRCSAHLRRRHESFIHPLVEIRAEPFPRQLSSQALFPARIQNQRADGGELDADAGVALIVNDFLVARSSGMRAGEHLTEFTNLFPSDLALIDQIEKLALLVVERRFLVVEHDKIAADHCRGVRF